VNSTLAPWLLTLPVLAIVYALFGLVHSIYKYKKWEKEASNLHAAASDRLRELRQRSDERLAALARQRDNETKQTFPLHEPARTEVPETLHSEKYAQIGVSVRKRKVSF